MEYKNLIEIAMNAFRLLKMCNDQQQLEYSSQSNLYLQIYHSRAISHINSIQSQLSLKLCLMAACLPA